METEVSLAKFFFLSYAYGLIVPLIYLPHLYLSLLQESQRENEKLNQISDFSQKIDLMEKRIILVEESIKKFITKQDEKFTQFSKTFSQQFEKFLKNAKERFDEFYDKEQQMRSFTQQYSEQVSIVAQQLTLSKEEYHISKNDLMDNLRDLSLSFKEIERVSLENRTDLQAIKPVINSIEDDLLQILKDHKDLTLKQQQNSFFEEDFNTMKDNVSTLMTRLRIVA